MEQDVIIWCRDRPSVKHSWKVFVLDAVSFFSGGRVTMAAECIIDPMCVTWTTLFKISFSRRVISLDAWH